jgi:hypothetical protein
MDRLDGPALGDNDELDLVVRATRRFLSRPHPRPNFAQTHCQATVV